jgi:AraC family transcriptional regulator
MTEFFGRLIAHKTVEGHLLSLRRYDTDMRVPAHEHTDSFLTIVIHGGFHEIHAGRSHACATGSVIVHGPGERHENRFSGRPTLCLSVQGCAFSRGAHLDWSAAATIGSRMYREFRNPDSLSPVVMQALLLELVVEMERGYVTERVPSWLHEVRLLMKREFPRQLTITALANHVDIHPTHLARSFRHHYGETIGDAMREMRVDFSRRQLIAGVALKDIAVSAGFADQSHFTRTFRRLTGTTPAAFRRRHAKPVPNRRGRSRLQS